MNNRSRLYILIIAALLVLVVGWYGYSFWLDSVTPDRFSGEQALADVQAQVAFGARGPGTEGHAQVQSWIMSQLESAGWIVEVQSSEMLGHPVENIVARRNDEAPQIILGAHYDTRFFADNDPEQKNHDQPVPGANDGASGVAVLLELARALPKESVPTWLVFFDTEDNGDIPGWDWILGSRAFVQQNADLTPRAVVIVDMVGDADLNLYLERNSTPDVRDEIWAVAASLGYGNVFIQQEKYSMEDDHTPFLEAGLPAVDIIDFDYPYWHTLEDTPDKISAASLEAVGATLLEWVTQQNRQR